MALATGLLASSGLLLHSFVNVMRADRGYQVERVLAVDLSLFGQRYAAAVGRAAFYRALIGNVRGIPGVEAAGAISELPAASESSGASRPVLYSTDTDFGSVVLSRPVAMIRSVTNGYFAAAGAALRAGRFFSEAEQRPIAVISESLAHRLWPHETPAGVVGRGFRHGNLSAPLIIIAGVVADARPGGVDRDPQPVIYRPYEQWPSGPMTLVVRAMEEPTALAPLVRTEIRKMDPNLPITSIRTLREIVSSAVAERRFQATLTTLFAVVALLLGAVGLYGVVSYSVTRRTREIGLRMALGAVKIDVLRSVMSSGMQPVAIGLAAGLGSAVVAATLLRSLLFGVAPIDPISTGAVVLVLLTASGLACYLPARRAAALDPVTALRHE
jgi:putative ABC transport system permease protein